MNAEWLKVVVQSSSAQVLNASIAGVLLAAIVWTLLQMLGGQNSRTRFAIWFCSLLTIAAMPLLFGTGISHLSSGDPRMQIALPGSLAFYLLTAWVIGSGFSFFKLCVGLWRVHQLRRDFVEVDVARLDPALAGRLSQCQTVRAVKFYASTDVSGPSAIGFLRPAIVFPAALLPQLSAEEIDIILQHELAHLRRWDDWTNLAQKIVKAVLFFHPAVWWIEQRLTLEREMACDDMVLTATGNPKVYASFLIMFAEKLQRVRGPALTQGLISRMGQMSCRVARILDTKRPTHTAIRKPLLAATAAVFVTVLAIAPYGPRLVAFQNVPKFASRSSGASIKGAKFHTVSLNNQSDTGAGSSRPLVPTDRARVQLKIAHEGIHSSARKSSLAVQPIVALKPAPNRADATVQAHHPRAIFVILQNTGCDPSGDPIWLLSVWRFEAASSVADQGDASIELKI